jgi:hypothetical protein
MYPSHGAFSSVDRHVTRSPSLCPEGVSFGRPDKQLVIALSVHDAAMSIDPMHEPARTHIVCVSVLHHSPRFTARFGSPLTFGDA